MLGGFPVPGILNETFQFTGKSAGCPAFLPVAGAERAETDSRRGVKADPVIISTIPGSPAPWAGSFNLVVSLDLEFRDNLF